MLLSYVAREDSWESLGQKGDQTSQSERDQSWILLGKILNSHWKDTEAEAPILWALDVKSQLIGKDSDVGEDWGQEKMQATEDEIVGRHPWLNGHDFWTNSGW